MSSFYLYASRALLVRRVAFRVSFKWLKCIPTQFPNPRHMSFHRSDVYEMGVSSKPSSGAPRHSSATRPAPRSINTPRQQEQLPADRRALNERLDRIEAREADITSKVESIETDNSRRDQKVRLSFIVAHNY